jgi:hypothetical protein
MIRQLFKILSTVVLRSKTISGIVEKVWPRVAAVVGADVSPPRAAAPVVVVPPPGVPVEPPPAVVEAVAPAPAPAAAPAPAPAPAATLRPLGAKETMDGSVWVPRILWALEYARRNALGPQSASDISRVLGQNGVTVPSTNVARAFRDRKQDSAYWTEHDGQRYEISDAGSVAISAQLARVPN